MLYTYIRIFSIINDKLITNKLSENRIRMHKKIKCSKLSREETLQRFSFISVPMLYQKQKILCN